MASSQEYIDFVCERLEPFGAVRSRKMFGDYMVYLDEKPLLLVCDNTVFVKKLPEIAELMHDAPCASPYDGAKEHYMLDVEDGARMERLIPVLAAAAPLPKPKKKKQKNA